MLIERTANNQFTLITLSEDNFAELSRQFAVHGEARLERIDPSEFEGKLVIRVETNEIHYSNRRHRLTQIQAQKEN